jgi:recombinational DNA repair protein (RecF pathway)
MQSEPAVQAACAVLSELSETFSHEGQSEPRFFRLVGAALDALERGAEPFSVIRYFEYWTLRLHGLLPNLAACSACEEPIPEGTSRRVVTGQGILCAACLASSGASGRRFSGEDMNFLETARSRPPAAMERGSAGAARPGGALEALLRGTLEAFAERPFRSYRHLQGAVAERPEREGAP